jgi:hypothetical protein
VAVVEHRGIQQVITGPVLAALAAAAMVQMEVAVQLLVAAELQTLAVAAEVVMTV